MKVVIYAIAAQLLLVACNHSTLLTPQGRYREATKRLHAAATEVDRFYALGDASKESFEFGKYDEAEKYATELKSITPKYADNWNYGNAIQDYNIVLGRLALRNGDTPKAREYLMAAGRSPGSPQMDSFGPNMSLAKDLLARGEKRVVMEYFRMCRSFWDMERGRLSQWTKEVEDGKIPDFGANLDY